MTTPSASPNSASADAGERTLIACPFVYANGRACTGHVVRVEAYKADLTWSADADGTPCPPSTREIVAVASGDQQSPGLIADRTGGTSSPDKGCSFQPMPDAEEAELTLLTTHRNIILTSGRVAAR